MRFEGLRPVELEGPIPPDFEALGARLIAYGSAVQWLGASRRPSDRFASYDELLGKSRLDHDGANVIPWLVEHPEALRSISGWYERNISARLEIEERPPVGYEAAFAHVGRPELRVNLLDTGEGNIQVLPVLAAVTAAQEGFGPRIVALEEPESHLHPRLQMALAERIREAIEGDSDVRIVLETHSEHLLLAVQKLVLTGFPREQLRLYWVEQLADGRTVATAVEVQADGSLDHHWPPGVFDDTLTLAAELIELQRQGGSS
ncbi:MAG: AAA family ATPase [Myxococcota bacterium]